MSAKRRELSPVMRPVEARAYLGGRAVLEAFLRADMLKPRCTNRKEGAKGRCVVLYSRGDIERCANELLEGRYPDQKGGDPTARKSKSPIL